MHLIHTHGGIEMNIAYISYTNRKEKNAICGINKKIENQVKALNEFGIKTKLYLGDILGYVRALPFHSSSINWEKIDINNINGLYIRYLMSDFQFICFLKKARKRKIKVIVEMPLYPYETEKINFIFAVRDRLYRKKLKKYVDRIVTFTDHNEILGVPTIKTVNPISVNCVKSIPSKIRNAETDEINIMIVANISIWHGCDRLILGLKKYYENNGKRKVVFHIVGNGMEFLNIKKLVDENGLNNYVVFYGQKTGDELDKIYERADIALDALGAHRKDDKYFGTLKSMEYLAKGLPFVTEYSIPDKLNKVRRYILKVPYDDSPINIDDVIMFYENICSEPDTNRICEMREAAMQYCDTSVSIKPIVDYLNS